jgi:hypothetical protein
MIVLAPGLLRLIKRRGFVTRTREGRWTLVSAVILVTAAFMAPPRGTPAVSAQQAPPPSPPAPSQPTAGRAPSLQVTDENRTMILMLLDRIQMLAADSLRGDSKIPKTTKAAGKLSIDRATVDEIVADVSQIKAMIQR